MNSFNHYSLGSVGAVAVRARRRHPGGRAGLRARGHRARAGRPAVGAGHVPVRARPDRERVAQEDGASGWRSSCRRTSPGRRAAGRRARRDRPRAARVLQRAGADARVGQSASSFARARARSSARERTPISCRCCRGGTRRSSSTPSALRRPRGSSSRATTSRATASSCGVERGVVAGLRRRGCEAAGGELLLAALARRSAPAGRRAARARP